MSIPERELVAIRTEEVGGHTHIASVKLADGSEENAADVLAAVKAHDAHYFMRHPQGKLLVRAQQCPDCEVEVLYA